MRFGVRPVRRSFLPVLIAACLLAIPATASASTDLGTSSIGTLVVDDSASAVFVSLPQLNQVDKFGFDGHLIGSIPNIYGAYGMTVAGGYLYVVENTAGAIVRINLSSQPYTPQTVVSGLNDPRWVAMEAGRLWTDESLAWPTGPTVISVNPTTGGTAALPGEYPGPDFATSPGDPDTLFVADDGQSPGAVYRFDVSGYRPRQVAANINTNQSNIENLVVSADGTRVIPSSGWPYIYDELDARSLQPDGLEYPIAGPYPSAVAVSGNGFIATGLTGGMSSPNIAVFPLGTPSSVFTAQTADSEVVEHGLGLSADGSHVFAVSGETGSNDVFEVFTFTPPTPPTPRPPSPVPIPPLPTPSPPTTRNPPILPNSKARHAHVSRHAGHRRHRRRHL